MTGAAQRDAREQRRIRRSTARPGTDGETAWRHGGQCDRAKAGGEGHRASMLYSCTLPRPGLTSAAGAAVAEQEIKDISIIGGGPTGLFAAFYAGMRGASARIIDALPALGGQLMALYPEKYIFDVAGFPKILAKDLVRDMAAQGLQFGATTHLGEIVTGLQRGSRTTAIGHFVLETSEGVLPLPHHRDRGRHRRVRGAAAGHRGRGSLRGEGPLLQGARSPAVRGQAGAARGRRRLARSTGR